MEFISKYKKLLFSLLTVVLIIAGSLLQSRILKVQASVQVLLVSRTAIAFGNIYPGQNVSDTYVVLLDTSANSANYFTTLEPVAGKLNLCPLLIIKSNDSPTEPDTFSLATLARPGDTEDIWQVMLDTPAIKGTVAQDHKGNIVVSSGDYECKIIITTNFEDNRRMTGGGSVFKADGSRVTHGFELHCDINKLPNRLEVNWPGTGKGKNSENNFHLEQLNTVVCSDDPLLHAEKPNDSWDTYTATGTGKLNGVLGATASWVFTDNGEPGKNDTMTITIKDKNGNIVLTVSGNLHDGNQQAH